MPFGRHRGKPLTGLPDDYVLWLYDLGDLREPLRGAVEAEHARRFGGATATRPSMNAEVRTMAGKIITTGYRSLAQDNHPDRGGTAHKMTVVNLAAEALRRCVRTELA